jgi:TatD DNase family protein
MLLANKTENAIFHWYSGSISVLESISEYGYYFSINSAMTLSENGRKIISKIPKDLILTETDSPYIENSNIKVVHTYLSNIWNLSEVEVEQKIASNFKKIVTTQVK